MKKRAFKRFFKIVFDNGFMILSKEKKYNEHYQFYWVVTYFSKIFTILINIC